MKMPADLFPTLYEANHVRVYAFLVAFLHDQEWAEDVAQETWIKVYRYLHTFDGRNAWSWLCTIAHHTALDAIRAKGRISRPQTVALEAALEISDPLQSPERLVLGQEAIEGLAEAFDSIFKEWRPVLVMRAQGYTYVEIAEHLHMNPATLKGHISRYRHKLRAAYEALEEAS